MQGSDIECLVALKQHMAFRNGLKNETKRQLALSHLGKAQEDLPLKEGFRPRVG